MFFLETWLFAISVSSLNDFLGVKQALFDLHRSGKTEKQKTYDKNKNGCTKIEQERDDVKDDIHVTREALADQTGDQGKCRDEEAHEGDQQQKEFAVLDFVFEDCALEYVMRLAFWVSRRIGELVRRGGGGQFGIDDGRHFAVQIRLNRRWQEERIWGRDDSIVMQITGDMHVVVQTLQADQQ